MSKGAFFIQPDRPLWRKLKPLLVLGLLVSLSVVFYQVGRQDGDSATEEAQTWMEEAKSQMELSQVAQRNLSAERERLAAAISIERKTGGKLRQELATTLKQLDRYEFELELIRNVMANTNLKRGLDVHGVNLRRAAEENVFSYSIVLVQLFNEAPQTIGDIDFRIDGSYRGRKVKYAYSDVSVDGTNRVRFSFRHYQQIEGSIRFPDSYVPERLTLIITPHVGSASDRRKTRSFLWSEVAESVKPQQNFGRSEFSRVDESTSGTHRQ